MKRSANLPNHQNAYRSPAVCRSLAHRDPSNSTFQCIDLYKDRRTSLKVKLNIMHLHLHSLYISIYSLDIWGIFVFSVGKRKCFPRKVVVLKHGGQCGQQKESKNWLENAIIEIFQTGPSSKTLIQTITQLFKNHRN